MMPVYSYQALDGEGQKKSGSVEADTKELAKKLLQAQGLMIVSIDTKKTESSKNQLKGDSLVAFTLQLAQMINAGMPLYDSLLILEEQYREESYHPIIMRLCESIKGGKSLSDAMKEFPESFNSLYCAMVAAGEAIGKLGSVLKELSLFLSKQMKLKKQITTALIYPMILMSFSFVLIAALIGFVVPSIEAIFSGRELNGFTQFVLSLSGFLRVYWWIYFPIIGGGIGYGVYYLKSSPGRIALQKVSLKIPFIKQLATQTAIARFCRTMSTLQQGGLTIVDSLQIARKTMRNVVLEREVEIAEEKIIEGSSLSIELGQSKWFPPMVSRMIAIGEDTGNTTEMFANIADMYEEELEKSLDRVMAMVQPIILITLGTVIGFILMAILLPLTDVSAFT